MTESNDSLAAPAELDTALGRPGEPMSEPHLDGILSLRYGKNAAGYVNCLISRPLADLLGRPGKRVRGRLVEHGARLAGGTIDASSGRLVDAIEALHAGSLSIDDLQDGSKMRRGAPALHVKYGVPIALNVGNLLYFWPAEVVSSLRLEPAAELRLLHAYHRTMVRAHLGQAIDVGVPIDTVPQEQVHDLCLAAMELKSGALFSLSLLFGALSVGADAEMEESIDAFGHGFGIGLQMFDDIGNLRGFVEPAKHREDLVLRRPTWIWACAARNYSRGVFADFISAVHQLSAGDPLPLETWLEQHDFIRRATRLAQEHMNRCFSELENRLGGRGAPAVRDLRALAGEIARAYE